MTTRGGIEPVAEQCRRCSRSCSHMAYTSRTGNEPDCLPKSEIILMDPAIVSLSPWYPIYCWKVVKIWCRPKGIRSINLFHRSAVRRALPLRNIAGPGLIGSWQSCTEFVLNRPRSGMCRWLLSFAQFAHSWIRPCRCLVLHSDL